MKKVNNILITLIIFVIPFITNINVVDAKILKYGDVNEDDIINQADELIVNQFIESTMTPTPIQKALADINNDGNIDNTDKEFIHRMINNTGEKLYQIGDVNMNDIIDPMDGLMIAHSVAGRLELNDVQRQLADTDNSGSITTLDINKIDQVTNSNLLAYKLGFSWDYNEPTFSSDSEDNGIYTQIKDKTKTDNGYPVVFYRGPVENNYVSFGTYKTDIINNVYNSTTGTYENKTVANAESSILWRIVSINYDGSIKLIAENNVGIPNIFNKNTGKYINDDGSNSDIKSELETWYNTHISVDKNVDSKIQKSNYCNDITDNYQAAYNRYQNKAPIFTCKEGAIIDNNKVGLLTADEMMYAGSLYNEEIENNTTYLNNNTRFWTMTPHGDMSVFSWNSTNKFIFSYVRKTSNAAARPVITLKPNVLVTGDGDGTKDNPYEIDLYDEERIFDIEYNPIIMNTINANNENIITMDVINKAKENNKIITSKTYNTSSENGNFKYSWSFGTENITEVKDINTTITTKDNVSVDDDEVYNRMKYALNNNDVRYVTLEQSGDLGLRSIIRLDVSDKYTDGSRIWIYRWDDTKRRYENPNVYRTTIKEGQIQFTTSIGGHYIISGSDLSSIIDNPPTGMMMFVVIGIIGLLLIGGITYLIYSKKNNRFLKA